MDDKHVLNTMAHSQNSKQINTAVPQGGVLSPTLFNIYTSDIPLPPKDVKITTYTDDTTIIASHTKHHKAQQIILLYIRKIYEWAIINNLHINTDKTTTTLFTQDPAEYSTTLSLKLNHQTLPTTKHPKILGTTLYSKLTFSQYISVTITKEKQTLNILKALDHFFQMGQTKAINSLHVQSYHLPHFKLRKRRMETYHIKHQHQETANHLKHSFANRYWL